MSYLPFRMEYLNGKKMFVDILSRPPGFQTCYVWNENNYNHMLTNSSGSKQKTPLNPLLKSFTQAMTLHNNTLQNRQSIILPPPSHIPSLLKQAHDQAGHLSSNYTLAKLSGTYSWPYMARDVTDYVRSCETCAKTNPARPHIQEGLKPLQPAAIQMRDIIHLDLLDMPRSNQGHVAICTLVDAATGFIITNPVTDKTSAGVVDTLVNKFIPYFGCPKFLVTDQGKENVNSEITALCQKYKINHIKSSVGHPQSNQMVERRQQMILSFLRKATQSYSDQGNWNLLLSDFQLIANSTISKSRKFSPFFLTFFRSGNFPFSELKQSKIDLNKNSQVAEHFNRTRKTLQLATEATTKAFASTSKEFDKKQNKSTISIGDLVFIKTSQRGKMHHKLANTYKGPYMCTDLLDNDNLLLTRINGVKTIKMHKNNCKKGIIRLEHLLLNETSQTPAPQAHTNEQLFDYSDQLAQTNIIYMEEDGNLLPMHSDPGIEENNIVFIFGNFRLSSRYQITTKI